MSLPTLDKAAYQRAWKENNPERCKAYARKHHLRRKYGMSFEEYEQRLADQGGVCAICGTDSPGIWDAFVVDHDHATGLVRGLLCSPCNTCLGQAKDRPEVLRKAAAYLEAHAH